MNNICLVPDVNDDFLVQVLHVEVELQIEPGSVPLWVCASLFAVPALVLLFLMRHGVMINLIIDRIVKLGLSQLNADHIILLFDIFSLVLVDLFIVIVIQFRQIFAIILLIIVVKLFVAIVIVPRALPAKYWHLAAFRVTLFRLCCCLIKGLERFFRRLLW